MGRNCITCGVDVTDAPELCDQDGNYYCEPCASATNREADELESAPASFVNPSVNVMPDEIRGISQRGTKDGLTEAAREILARIKDDAGPFKPLADEFVLGGTFYEGAVTVSPSAFYLVNAGIKRKPGAGAAVTIALSRPSIDWQ